ncbi:MAG TPA: ATP-binding protein [Blastocatellia bacterium]|nr:ATP-binding protein [Blastocatellia bacterium]
MAKAKLIAVLAVTVVVVVIGVLNLRDRLSPTPVPSDGIEWVNTEQGVQAKAVNPDSPLAFAVKKGDYLRAVYFVGRYSVVDGTRVLPYEEIKGVEDIHRYLDRQGVGNDARYAIEHSNPVLQGIYGLDEPLYDVDFKVQHAPQYLGRGLYLAFIGVVYLAIGLFVLFRQNRAALTYHFFFWSLLSFITYFYSSTLEFTRHDRLVSLLDNSAWALLAPLFLHFCANFPSGRRLSARSHPVVFALYLPAVILITFEILWHYDPDAGIFGSGGLVQARDLLDKVGLVYGAVFFIAGSALLLRTFIRAEKPLLRQQLKWIVWGIGISGLPFAALYVIPYISSIAITPLMETMAYGPLILIPLAFGYSIVRYRLMDVDVIMRRSFVHVVAIVAVAAIYMVMLLGVGDLVKFIWATADLNSGKTRVVVVIGMLIVTLLFAPIKNKLQLWADRWFYGESYNLRTGLQDFGRTLAQTTALPQLLDSLVRRMSDMLNVRKVAIFIEDEMSPSGFRLAPATGIDGDIQLPENIKQIIRLRSIGRGFISASDIPKNEASLSAAPQVVGDGEASGYGLQQSAIAGVTHFVTGYNLSSSEADDAGAPDELHYYVPCIVRDRMVAIIGIGRTTTGALLTSEDTDLLRTLSGYVAVAIDNSLLYRSEMEKAEELSRLKEFSESIIESVNVGILAVDFDGRVTTWNSALEEIFGVSRERALRRSIHDILDRDLIETIQNVIGQDGWALRETRHIYKYNASTEDGRPLTLNISLAPFEAARGVVTGTLVVVENVTDRAQLEEQLLQREKLSSIGLLAAGVAHEVNTPLAGISSYAQMLLQQVPDQDPKRKLLEKIHTQTLRASGIVNNLLNFSRTGDAQFREVDLNRVLDDTVQLLEPQLRNARLEIIRNYAEDLPAAHGNASKLQQVFMNLMLNARDAMPGGGRLTINTRLVDTSLVVDFRDTGCGIAPENIARIYDPFFTTKEVGQGTGLGLALSYGIIQEHGGRIFVESRPGEGAHFTIKLSTAFARQMQAASD